MLRAMYPASSCDDYEATRTCIHLPVSTGAMARVAVELYVRIDISVCSVDAGGAEVAVLTRSTHAAVLTHGDHAAVPTHTWTLRRR